MWVLRTWLRLALAVVARAGGFRVQTECAWHWGQFRGQLCIDLFWSDRPQRPATVSHCIPTILLQHFTTLPGLWDHTQHINTRPVDGRECQWLYTYLQICSLNPLYTWRNMCNCLICFVGEMLKVNMTIKWQLNVACDSLWLCQCSFSSQVVAGRDGWSWLGAQICCKMAFIIQGDSSVSWWSPLLLIWFSSLFGSTIPQIQSTLHQYLTYRLDIYLLCYLS